MKRILAAGAATAAASAAALAVTIAWTGTAAAAPGQPAKADHGRLAAAQQAAPPVLKFATAFRGQYVTLVKCSGGTTPPPVHLGSSAQPLTVTGSGSSATALKSLSAPGAFKPAYLCTILVEKRVPPRKVPKKVVIETGFGGEAGAVAHHHPRG